MEILKKFSLKPFNTYHINAAENLLQHPFKMVPSQNAERSPSSVGAIVALFLPAASREAVGGNKTDRNCATCVGQFQIPNP